jgi:hypothetical protein
MTRRKLVRDIDKNLSNLSKELEELQAYGLKQRLVRELEVVLLNRKYNSVRELRREQFQTRKEVLKEHCEAASTAFSNQVVSPLLSSGLPELCLRLRGMASADKKEIHKVEDEEEVTIRWMRIAKETLKEKSEMLCGETNLRDEICQMKKLVCGRRFKEEVLGELKKRSADKKEHDEKYGIVFHELVKKLVFRELQEHTKVRRKLHENLDQVVQELTMRFKANHEFHERSARIILELVKKWVTVELNERNAARKALYEKYDLLLQELTMKFVLQELKSRSQSIEDLHRKSKKVVQELKDRWDWIEIQEFKQLVIQDMKERSQAVQEHHGRSRRLRVELLNKFVLDELQEKLPTACQESNQKTGFMMEELTDTLDWVRVVNVHKSTNHKGMMEWSEVKDRSEWVVCEHKEEEFMFV